MTDHSRQEMKSACHYMAEYIMRRPCRSNRCKWLRDQLVDLLKSKSHIDWYAEQYGKEYPYADAPNEYFAEMLKEYDQEVS